MSIEVTVLIGIVGLAATIITLTNTFKKQNSNDGLVMGQLLSSVASIKDGNETIQLEIKDLSREHRRLGEALISTQKDVDKALERADQAYKHANEAHSRINKIKGSE